MKLQTPVTGTVIDVAEDQAWIYTSKGFKPVEEPKKQTRKRTTKKEQ